MDNPASTVSLQENTNTGNPLNLQAIPPSIAEPESTITIDALVSNQLEPVSSPVDQTNVDGNVQAHFDINYQPHDVALASAKGNSEQNKTGLTLSEHKMDIDAGDEHPDKSKSCCSSINKFLLTTAIVCLALLLCSIAYIIINLQGLNGKYGGHGFLKLNPPYPISYDLNSLEKSIDNEYFNLTNTNDDGITIVLARRGASVKDILIPYKNKNGSKEYRSIVVKGGQENHFGSVRFGFDNPVNSTLMTNQLPNNYPFYNFHTEDWLMYADANRPNRVRFVKDLVQVVYELSLVRPSELSMTTMIGTLSNQRVIVDPTNNIYFNLRGDGNLSTHYLNLSSSNPINIVNGQKVEQDRLIQSQQVDKLINTNKYFYELDRAGIGKNYIATLSESETKTTMHVFSDHAGVVIDPFGVGLSNENVIHVTSSPTMHGVRISPRQSPVYQPIAIYGPTLITYPSQAIHTTWWQFEYEH